MEKLYSVHAYNEEPKESDCLRIHDAYIKASKILSSTMRPAIVKELTVEEGKVVNIKNVELKIVVKEI